MLNNSSNNQSRLRPDASKAPKSLPRLSLNLHTMPPTESGHWTKWLVLGFGILGVIALAAYFIFSQ
jgi:hypothetical protein